VPVMTGFDNHKTAHTGNFGILAPAERARKETKLDYIPGPLSAIIRPEDYEAAEQ
jgi:hypothetical protein